jgi:DNA gyrase inhibitor GyrI
MEAGILTNDAFTNTATASQLMSQIVDKKTYEMTPPQTRMYLTIFADDPESLCKDLQVRLDAYSSVKIVGREIAENLWTVGNDGV